jgi:hypothetical protein
MQLGVRACAGRQLQADVACPRSKALQVLRASQRRSEWSKALQVLRASQRRSERSKALQVLRASQRRSERSKALQVLRASQRRSEWSKALQVLRASQRRSERWCLSVEEGGSRRAWLPEVAARRREARTTADRHRQAAFAARSGSRSLQEELLAAQQRGAQSAIWEHCIAMIMSGSPMIP